MQLWVRLAVYENNVTCVLALTLAHCHPVDCGVRRIIGTSASTMHVIALTFFLCSVKASAAAATLRAEVAELAKKADLIQVLLGNSIPVSMQSLDTEEQVCTPVCGDRA